ncbi:MAG: DedA family protein [Alphaproteobacteria bacterium]|nr:DedA family protein [Alphaproteobacteria bacterium]
MFERLYARTMELAASRHAVWWLLALAVAEASFFPVPVEALLLPMMFATPSRAWFLALLATIGTVVGGVTGYAIGLFLHDTIAWPVLEFYGYAEAYAEYATLYNVWGAWIVFAGGFTPIPYKVVTIASGAMHLDIWVFVAASAASRGLRFAIEAALLSWFAVPVRGLVERHLTLAGLAMLAALVVGFVAIRWIL